MKDKQIFASVVKTHQTKVHKELKQRKTWQKYYYGHHTATLKGDIEMMRANDGKRESATITAISQSGPHSCIVNTPSYNETIAI